MNTNSKLIGQSFRWHVEATIPVDSADVCEDSNVISRCATASTSSACRDICFLTRCQAPPLAPGPRRTFESRSCTNAAMRCNDYIEGQSLDPLVAPVADFHGAAKLLGLTLVRNGQPRILKINREDFHRRVGLFDDVDKGSDVFRSGNCRLSKFARHCEAA